MASLREIRKKIKSIKSTLSVTKAMKMVAAVRLTKAQERILAARPFALRMQELLEDVDSEYESNHDSKDGVNPFLVERPSSKELLVVVSGDKGLCGAFNGNAIRAAIEYMGEHKDIKFEIIAIGKKARDYFTRFKYPVVKGYANIFSRLGFVHAELIGGDIIELFNVEGIGKVHMIYNSFKNAFVQRITNEIMLPIEKPPSKKGSKEKEFLYEPPQKNILESLIPRYIKAQIFRVLMDSYAAELAARMMAMDSATSNALELIDFMNLKFNNLRQELITRDLSELVGGAEALNN